MGAFTAVSSDISIPYSIVSAPVVHSGKFHILSCGNTYVVVDGSRGMSLCAVGKGEISSIGINSAYSSLKNGCLKVSLIRGGETIELDQAHDPSARLQIIDQSAGRVAARSFFTLCNTDGVPYGSGTMDIYLYEGRVHLVPSIHIDYEKGGVVIKKAGFFVDIPGDKAELISGGVTVMSRKNSRFIPFGADSTGFNINIDNPGRHSVKIGWSRNLYPPWLYMREIDKNPETDELYEKWPPWITQRNGSISWIPTENSGLMVDYSSNSVKKLSFLWANGDSLKVPSGGYYSLNGIMGLFLAENAFMAHGLWKNHEEPVEPSVTKGDFRYYNEIEGLYEIDSQGDNIDVSFDNLKNKSDRPVFMRIWNLEGNGAYEVKIKGKNVPFSLYNDGDIIDDPMVSVVKTATGPATFAGVAFNIKNGSNSRVRMTGKPGLQFTYQMYSELETYEAWSDACTDKPLFSVYQNRAELAYVTLPGKDDYAVFKLPLYWLKNGVNFNTFMNLTRGFVITYNGPDRIRFSLTSVNLQATGLSTYTVEVPYLNDRLQFDIQAEFTPLDDGVRWTSIEYCDLYPFDNVYRRTFHYDDVTFLNQNGIFDRVGTGAWQGRFATLYEEGGSGYYGESASREGPGSRCPDTADGTVWILGNNLHRGNILYRRGYWSPSAGARSVFTLCNAWVDIHNVITNREEPSSGETIKYTVEIFGGPVPTVDEFNTMYTQAAGGETVKQVIAVNYGEDGSIAGFEVEK